jgi:hypothetical protein
VISTGFGAEGAIADANVAHQSRISAQRSDPALCGSFFDPPDHMVQRPKARVPHGMAIQIHHIDSSLL